MITIPLQPVTHQKMYYRIIISIIGMIQAGTLTYGQKLYNEEELAEMLQVSRPTLREALRVLEFLGIVTTRPRKGIIINDPTHRTAYVPLEMILTFEKTDKQDLFELRRAIEIENAGNAAERATEEQLTELESIEQHLEESSYREQDAFQQLHARFHLQIARCARNNLNLRLLNSVMLLIDQQVTRVYGDLSSEEQTAVRRSHKLICKAIRAQDREAAQQLMTSHMNYEPMIHVMKD